MTDRIVVTGGAGFVGSHLCESLVDDGHDVSVVDNLETGREGNLSGFVDALALERHDVREPLGVDGPIDTIYHLASRASPREFEEYAIEIAETNAFGSHNVLELAAETDATVVLASTSEVYGDAAIHPQPEFYTGNVDPRGPRGAYDEGKRFMEALGMAYHRKRGVDVRTVRIFNTYGPRMRPSDGRVVPAFINQALDGEPLTVHGSGDQTRSFCYVDDLVRGLRAVGSTPEMAGGVVNLGSTDEVSISKLARTVVALTDSDSPIKHVERPADDPQIRRPKISRANERLDWEPETGLEDGLRETIRHVERQRGMARA